MLQWLYLQNPSLDHAAFWIYCSSHTPLLTDWRDWKSPICLTEIIIGNVMENKRKYTCRAVWSPADFALFHRWIILILGYVVRLDVAFILDGGERKHILRQGFMHIEQQLVHFQVSLFYSDLGRSNRWIILILSYIVQKIYDIQSDRWV